MFRGITCAILLSIFSVSVCAQDHIERSTFQSQILSSKREIVVALPQNYRQNLNATYPVLYLLDGHDQIDHVYGTSKFLSLYNNVPETIIVGIQSGNRLQDLTPSSNANPTSGKGELFLDFIEGELIPHINNTYRTADYKVFAGHSLGGLLVLHSFQTRPNLFQAHLAFSPSLWWNEQEIITNAKGLLKQAASNKRYLYMNLGSETEIMVNGFEAYRALLEENRSPNLTYKVETHQGETHTTTPIIGFFNAYRDLYKTWKLPNAKYPEGLASVSAYHANLSDHYGYNIVPAEAIYNNLGHYYLSVVKDPKLAIKAFEKNIENYPYSARAFGNLAVGLERDNQIEEAIKNFEKAMTLVNTDSPDFTVFMTNRDRLSALIPNE
ncbi:alpha/beta hydrolase-fold protein [Kordiimonas sp. SCSIO 12610]|uniref:alpha/beta hydrolase-fold protein n=1 Tax=Kordiimonas sp. SCSIO 12610 TaxID=2829597 RepID=UPI00210EA3D5|nr:alpha/beta hydrolase-fold protein [Kordiimonas sp. SCSIO 12610]UTW56296.1 hypothetical protein KFF44_05180 [Kordiimonas sp. SCSIO 12610]